MKEFWDDFEGVPAFKFFKHDLPEMFQRFNKQRDAFAFFDELPNQDRRNVKIFQIEMPSSGTRQFVVCSAKKYFSIFNSIKDIHIRHHYEIIRDGFPCRAYFDLEFSKADNANSDGEAMTESWIQCVAWKIYHLFGILIGPQNFVVLDSSTESKFSKHITVHVPVHPDDAGLEKKEYLFLNNLCVGLFVDALMSDMLEDAKSADENAGADGKAPSHLNGCTFEGCRQIPKPQYAHFWVRNKDGKPVCFADLGVYTRNRLFRLFGSCKFGKTATLSLSVQDKRKYWNPGRTGFNAKEARSENQPWASSSLHTATLQREDLAKLVLEASFVVPMDLFLTAALPIPKTRESNTANNKHLTAEKKASRSPLQENCLDRSGSATAVELAVGDKRPLDSTHNLACDINASRYNEHIPEDFMFASSSSNTGKGLSRSPEITSKGLESAPVPTNICEVDPLSFNEEYACLFVMKSGQGSYLGAVGAFPATSELSRQVPVEKKMPCLTAVDPRVLDSTEVTSLVMQLCGTSIAFAQNTCAIARPIGGSPAKWSRTAGTLGATNGAASKDWLDRQLAFSDRANQPSPFPSVDEFVRRFIHRIPEIRGGIHSWTVYGAPSAHQLLPAIKIRYQINHYRWCARVARQHKSNQIILNIDVGAGIMVQSCWDPDCRGYRSPPIPLPQVFVPDVQQVRYFQDICLEEILMLIEFD